MSIILTIICWSAGIFIAATIFNFSVIFLYQLEIKQRESLMKYKEKLKQRLESHNE